MSSAPGTVLAAVLADELTEREASVRVFLTAGGLVVLGLALLLCTIWWWRGTRPEPPALGPLEVMSDRRWIKLSEAERRRLIDQHRPAGSAALAGVVAPVPIDLSVLARGGPANFDDLRDVAPEPVAEPEVVENASGGPEPERAVVSDAERDAMTSPATDAAAADDTMQEVEAPPVQMLYGDEELVIDPLLQRTVPHD